MDSCSLHATFQSVRVLYLFFSFLIVILLVCYKVVESAWFLKNFIFYYFNILILKINFKIKKLLFNIF